jgi:hypothetical protein
MAMDFNHYFNNEELDAALNGWAERYRHLAEVSELGRSHEGKPIPLLTLTNKETGADSDKPAIWVDANIHATEVAGTTVALHIAHTLLNGHGSDARCTRLLDNAAFYRTAAQPGRRCLGAGRSTPLCALWDAGLSVFRTGGRAARRGCRRRRAHLADAGPRSQRRLENQFAGQSTDGKARAGRA